MKYRIATAVFVFFLSIVGFWSYINMYKESSKADTRASSTVQDTAIVSFSSPQTFLNNGLATIAIFIKNNPLNKLSSATILLHYSPDKIKYIPENVDHPYQSPDCVNMPLPKLAKEKDDPIGGTVVLSHVGILPTNNLPSGSFCLTTATFQMLSTSPSVSPIIISMNAQDTAFEAAGPDVSYTLSVDPQNSQTTILNPPSVTPTETVPPPTSTSIPTATAIPTNTPTPNSTYTPVPTLTPTVTQAPKTIYIKPTADSTIQADKSTKNYGTDKELSIDLKPQRISYLKFDLTPLANKRVLKATLKLTLRSSLSNTLLYINTCQSNTWDEKKITYKTKIICNTQGIIGTISGKSKNVSNFDVTQILQLQTGILTSIELSSPVDRTIHLYSKEDAVYYPKLEIIYQ